MYTRDLTGYPGGGETPMPPPPYHLAADEPAGTAGFAASRHEGQQHTLNLTGPAGAGDLGYLGRDVTDPATPYYGTIGMFRRLHNEGGGE